MRKNQKGFSLIELLVVVAIMLVLAAIAIPAAISSMQAGNESSTASNIRALITANTNYQTLYGVGYAASPVNLSMAYTGCPNTPDPAATAGGCMLATGIANALAGTVSSSGYQFAYAPSATTVGTSATPVTFWSIVATPTASLKGRKNLCGDFTGSLVWSWTANPLTPTAAGLCPAVDNSKVFALGN